MFKILLVDDTNAVHAFVKDLMKKVQDVQFVDVFNGQEAIDLLRMSPNFDLILLDWEMPIMNGPTTLANIKALGIQAPVVMMTTKNAPEDIAAMLERGAAEYLMKPFTVDILLEKIEFATGKGLLYAA